MVIFSYLYSDRIGMEITQAIHKERILILTREHLWSPLFNIPVIFLYLYLWTGDITAVHYTWIAIKIVLICMRFALNTHFNKNPDTNLKTFEILYCTVCGLTGLTVGMAPSVFFDGTISLFMQLTLINMALVAGFVLICLPSKMTGITYTLALFSGFIYIIATTQIISADTFIMAIGFFIVFLIKVSQKGYDGLVGYLHLLQEKEGLLDQIKDKVVLENELQQERQSKFNSAKLASLGEMAQGVAHEINNPLTIAIGQLRIIRYLHENFVQRNQKVDAQKIIRTINRTNVSLERIARIIKGMRTFCANTDSHGEKNIVDAKKLIEDSMMFCEERLKNGLVKVDITIEENFDVYCLPIEVSQVILNLILNSFDACSEEKDPQQYTISLRTFKRDDQGIILVQDDGPGIDQKYVEKILQPFFTTKDVGKSTGLGLSVALGIIESHHGQLVLVSNKKPTIFEIRMPLYTEQALLKSA